MSLGMDVGASVSLGAVMSRLEVLEARLSGVEDAALWGANLAPYGPGGFGISEGGGGAGIQPFTIVSEESSDSEGQPKTALRARYCVFMFGRKLYEVGEGNPKCLDIPAGAGVVYLEIPHARPSAAKLVKVSDHSSLMASYFPLYKIKSSGAIEIDYRGLPVIVVRD